MPRLITLTLTAQQVIEIQSLAACDADHLERIFDRNRPPVIVETIERLRNLAATAELALKS